MRRTLSRELCTSLVALGSLAGVAGWSTRGAAASPAANQRPVHAAAATAPCNGDLNGDNAVRIDEIIAAVNSALTGCPSPSGRFVDKRDGTIADTLTGLEWEKKTAFDGIPHAEDLNDGDNLYSWAGGGSGIGSLFHWVGQLNERQFAGHDDWRMPAVEELRNIVNCTYAPCIDPAFGQTIPDCAGDPSRYANPFYWSATSNDNNPVAAFVVDFVDGSSQGDFSKGLALAVRAVRDASSQPTPRVDPTPCGTDPEPPINEGSRETPVGVMLDTPRCGDVATRGESFYLVTGLAAGSTHTVQIALATGDARLRVFADTIFVFELDCTLQAISPRECTLTTDGTIAFSVAADPVERVGATYLIEVE